MKYLFTLVPVLAIALSGPLARAAPLRVLIATDTTAFGDSYAAALKAGGAQVVVAGEPDAGKLAQADVVLMQREKFEAWPVAAQTAVTEFAKRGGGVVAVNGAVAAGPAAWGEQLLGGGWNEQESSRFNSLMMLYVVSDSHPIVKGASPFDIADDTLYDLDLDDHIFVLASAFTPRGRNAKRGDGPSVPGSDVRVSVHDLQPQMWTFEAPTHRAAVLLQGAPETLAHASIRSFILRSVAWTAKRDNTDELCSKADLANLRYPAGGPRRGRDAIKQFRMQPGFTASVIAEEPLISKPIAIQWDGKGRLWVAETPEYPNGRRPLTGPAWKETGVLEPGNYDRPGRDSISMLEDTNGDGLMDKRHVFFTGLELVTGFCFHEDGVIAVAQPNIVFLQDVDGDGSAELATPLFGGFTPSDTHFVANHFISAPDGWIYASNGRGAAATNPKTGEVMAKISPGVFRFKPDGSVIEQVASQGGNSFGGEVTSDMEHFHGKATSGNPVQHVALPEWVLSKARNINVSSSISVNPGRPVLREDLPDRAPLMQIDQVGRYSAACSTAIYEDGAWPEEYGGKIFTSEPILDIIHMEAMVPDGPSFKGELILKDQEWLRSMDYWFCPIDVSFGPDGAMYILDFYTPVVAHSDSRGPARSKSSASIRPDRDHEFGRIYRVQSDSAKKFAIPDLSEAEAAVLVAAFLHPNKTVRFNAIRILLEQPEEFTRGVLPALTTMATSEPFTPARIQALWALQRLGGLKTATLEVAFTAEDSKVRKNAMLIVEAGGIPLGAKEAAAGIADQDARVRLATLRALGASALSPEVSAVLLASASSFPDDWSKAAAAAAGARDPSSQLEMVLAGTDSTQTEESVRSLAAALAADGDPAQLLGVLRASADSHHPELVMAVLSELGKNPPQCPANKKEALDALRPILRSSNQPLAGSALPLAVAWDSDRSLYNDCVNVSTVLQHRAGDAGLPEEARVDAIRTLVAARSFSPKLLDKLLDLFRGDLPDGIAKELISELATTGDPTVGTALIERYPALPPGQQETAFTALVSRSGFATLLLDAVEAKKFDPAKLAPGQISRLTSHPDAAIAKRSSARFGGAISKDEIIARLLPEIEKPGDIAKGKVMFTALCSTCHQLEGAGYVFGPALEGIGSHPVMELLTHIVNPSLVVDDEHRTWNISMKDGSQYSALIASENDARVQIRQPGGITVDLKAGDIATRTRGDNSLMPEGLEAMGVESLRDVVAYIRSCAPKSSN